MTDIEINLLTMRKYEVKNYRADKKIKIGGERWRIAPQMMGNFSSYNPRDTTTCISFRQWILVAISI